MRIKPLFLVQIANYIILTHYFPLIALITTSQKIRHAIQAIQLYLAVIIPSQKLPTNGHKISPAGKKKTKRNIPAIINKGSKLSLSSLLDIISPVYN